MRFMLAAVSKLEAADICNDVGIKAAIFKLFPA